MNNHNQFETQSAAESMRSSASKHGKYVPKHCLLCENKIFKRWSDHIAARHYGDKTIKGIDCRTESCTICFDQGAIGIGLRCHWYRSGTFGIGLAPLVSVWHLWYRSGTFETKPNPSKKSNKHQKIPCSECNELKRSDTLDKTFGKCSLCLNKDKLKPFKQSKPAKSIIISKNQTNLLGKRINTANPDALKKAIDLMQHRCKELDLSSLTITEEEEGKETKLDGNSVHSSPPFDDLSQVKFKCIEQGMRDMEALQVIKQIEEKTMPLENKESKLLKVVPYLTQKTVATYLESELRPQFALTLLVLLKGAIIFDENILVSMAYAAIITGAQTWSALPDFLQKMNPALRISVLKLLQPLSGARFGSIIAKWICDKWQHLTDQTLELICYLDNKPSIHCCSILNLSLIANSSDHVADFVEACESFVLSPSLLNIVLEALKTPTTQSKMSLKQFSQLLSELRKDQNTEILKINSEELLSSPVAKWYALIEGWQSKALIEDVSAVQLQLDILQQQYPQYGALPTQFKKDLTISSPFIGYVTRNLAKKPNNLQFAMAQYSMAMIKKLPRQLVIFGAGQGKSFIEKLIVFLLLQTESTNRVHIIYSNLLLLNRDKVLFQELAKLASLKENQVCFQLNISFKRDPLDIVIIDESDALIFSDPEQFNTLIKDNCCICLTATPDDNDKQGMEKGIIDAMGLKRVSAVGLTDIAAPSIDRTLPIKTATMKQELLIFIKEKLTKRAVLLYCGLSMKEFLLEQKQPFFFIDDAESDAFLGNMDTIQEDGSYMLVVTIDPKIGMRGLDYRAPLNGITLIAAASFENEREKVQGLYRVGRYQDPCERIALECVPLINREQEVAYYG